ncbi:MAG: lamin tail domain-containing protein [Balneolaceae bacterium]|nr:lamin tail domain-containing protein [Balneolaceae bacterium]
MANEITEDTTAPHIIDYEITTNQSMVLFFSERLEAGSATHISNYGMNDISINNARLTDPDSVELSFETPLQNNTHYSLTIAGVEDIFGNTISSESISFTHYEISKADSGDIVINEFMYDPPPGPTEYIELYNSTERSFDLQGSTLNDNTGRTKVLTNQQFILPPDSFAVIAPDSTLFKSFPGINLLAMGNRFPSLNNGGDEIIIRKSNGTLIDSLQYRSSWGGNEVSLERRSSSVAGIYRENWMDASKSPGSPGQQNTATPDQTPQN